jgi:Ser/Thr protein kinase RdoA (MazF antagonist)
METRIQEAIAHFQLKVTDIQTVTESHSSTVKILTLAANEKLVLKIPFTATKLKREMAMLKILEGKLPVPRLIDSWISEEAQPGVLLLSFIPGQPLTGPITFGLAFKLGALLAGLHTNTLTHFGDEFQPVQNHSWWAQLNETFQSWQPFCARIMPSGLIEQVLDRYNLLYSRLPAPDGPCLVHFDYRPGNVLVQGEQLTGLIDFESARGGSADLDFTKIKAYIWETFPGTKEPFLQGYTSIRPLPPIEETLLFYELYNAFGGVAWCVRRNKLTDPFLSYNLEKLKQLLAGE